MEIPEAIANRLKIGRVMLFLGAGASSGSGNSEGDPPLGEELARRLSEAASIPFDPGTDTLGLVSANAKNILGDLEYLRLLRRLYGGCRPSLALRNLSQFYWPRIYTTNIDDAVEAAFTAGDRAIEVVAHTAPVRLYPQRADATQFIKLNGDVRRLENGVIFTEEEYFSYQGRIDTWYEELARDFMDYTFLFVGTKLNEPVFWHHIRRLASATGMRAGQAFVVSPSFSPNVRRSLSDRGIEPLEGRLVDVVEGLRTKVGNRLTSENVVDAQNDAVELLRSKTNLRGFARFSDDLKSLTVVNRRLLLAQSAIKEGEFARFTTAHSPRGVTYWTVFQLVSKRCVTY